MNDIITSGPATYRPVATRLYNGIQLQIRGGDKKEPRVLTPISSNSSYVNGSWHVGKEIRVGGSGRRSRLWVTEQGASPM